MNEIRQGENIHINCVARIDWLWQYAHEPRAELLNLVGYTTIILIFRLPPLHDLFAAHHVH